MTPGLDDRDPAVGFWADSEAHILALRTLVNQMRREQGLRPFAFCRRGWVELPYEVVEEAPLLVGFRRCGWCDLVFPVIDRGDRKVERRFCSDACGQAMRRAA